MTRKDRIIKYLKKSNLTCQELTKKIIKAEGLTDANNVPFDQRAKYLSGSISSILAKERKKGTIIVVAGDKGPRGGMVFQLTKNAI